MVFSFRAARRISLLVGLCASVLWTAPASADARSDYLVRLLRGSSQFRVRAQAAISLGNAAADSEVLAALSLSLQDEHPAVRAASATSLGRLGDGRALGALRAAASDAEAPVQVAVRGAIAKLEGVARMAGVDALTPTGPRGPPKYYVAFGRPGARAQGLPDGLVDEAQRALERHLGGIDGVVLAPSGEAAAAASAVLKRQRLRGFYIDSSITSFEVQAGGGTRVALSVIVQTYPGRDMRAMMSGAATVMGGGQGAGAQAVERAVQSALRQLPAAMARE